MPDLKSLPVSVPVAGTALTNPGAAVPITLRTVTNGKSYALTNMELTTDALPNAPVLAQVQVAGVLVYAAFFNNVTPLRWTNAWAAIEATSGQAVELVLGQTAGVQKVAYNAGQAEY